MANYKAMIFKILEKSKRKKRQRTRENRVIKRIPRIIRR